MDQSFWITHLSLLKVDEDYWSKLNSKILLCKHSISVSSPHPPLPRSPFPAGEGKVDSGLITFVQRISFWYIIFHSKKEYFIEKVCKNSIMSAIDSNKLFIFAFYWIILNNIRWNTMKLRIALLPSPAGKGDHASGGWGEETEAHC